VGYWTQLTSDGQRPYLEAVEGASGITRQRSEAEKRYSPAKCIGCEARSSAEPFQAYLYQLRGASQFRFKMGGRRYTRLTNAFSRKIENHSAAVALYYFAYNFINIHRTLRVTPAMTAGVTTRLWEVSDLVALLEPLEQGLKEPRNRL
jgi:hypothetical protein